MPKIKIIVYANPKHEAGKRLQQIIRMRVPCSSAEICPSIGKLDKRLHQPLNSRNIGIFLAFDRQELIKLRSLRYLFRGLRTILILPDRDEGTIALGHSMVPRFLTFADSSFSDVAAVLQNMIENFSQTLT